MPYVYNLEILKVPATRVAVETTQRCMLEIIYAIRFALSVCQNQLF